MSTQDKAQRTVAVYFETIAQRKRLERDAKKLGVGMSKLIKMALEVGLPVVVQNMKKMHEHNDEAAKTITDKTKVNLDLS